MNEFEKAKAIAEQIKSIIGSVPDAAVVLGSGLGAFADSIIPLHTINYSDIKHFPNVSVSGHAGQLIFGEIVGKKILAFNGRFHAYEGIDIKDVTLYVRVLKALNVNKLIVTNAAGAINKKYNVGDLMIIKDHISLFCDSPLFGPNDETFGPRFPSMGEVYSKRFREIIKKIGKKSHIKLREGVYVYTKGPMIETPAEIDLLRSLKADACGMSTVPEAIVASHENIELLGISCITNMAAGHSNHSFSHEDVLRHAKNAENKFNTLFTEFIKQI